MMTQIKLFIKYPPFFLFFLLIFFDQYSKYKIHQFGGFYICNKGVAFGLILPNLIYWLILAFFLIFLASFRPIIGPYLKNRTDKTIIILILAGGFSNFIDRIQYNCVIDFILMPFINFPLFNLADIFIFGGVLLFLSRFLKRNG